MCIRDRIVGFLGAVLLAIVGLGLTALFFNADSRMVDEKVTDQLYPQFQSVKAEQIARIEGKPRRVEVMENDQKMTTVVIPIDRAMELYAKRASQEQSAFAATQPAASP